MKDIFLVNYSVRGIKTLDELVSLSFYKKTISNELNTQEYNIKGIYGMNGSGKSAIVTSVDILKNLLVNPSYLNNPIAQKNLEAIVNKKIGKLYMEADFIAEIQSNTLYFRYCITLAKDALGKYVIAVEELSFKNATSKKDNMIPIFKVVDGEVTLLNGCDKDEDRNVILKKTVNLLSTASMCVLIYEKIFVEVVKKQLMDLNFFNICSFLLYCFGKHLHVYLDVSDDHRDYFIDNSNDVFTDGDKNSIDLDSLLDHFIAMDSDQVDIISISSNYIAKGSYKDFEKKIKKLCEFLQIFKSDLKGIEIDRKEDRNIYVCGLIMVYDSYKIHAEFESTGIKKLIRLYAYLKEMVNGGIVFIDEFDSNLHDVYLCALLEYLMEYGEGQLCFTTHNVGPMDVLKKNKKSIDFLSLDHRVYPWTTNGNYSPSKLYRNGMIEGSPFNIDSTDFIGVFYTEGEVDEWASS